MNKKLLGLIAPAFLVISLTSCNNNIEVFNMNDDVCVAYLNAKTSKAQFDAIYPNISSRTGVAHDIAIPYIMSCPADGSETYEFHIANKSDYSDETVITAYIPKLSYENLIPGKTYYWKIIGSKNQNVLRTGNFKVNKDNVRWINAHSVGNVRDLGGWDLPNNRQIKFGMLYRGRNTDGISHADQTKLRSLGIKTQFDLRKDSDTDPAPSKHGFDDQVRYCYYGDTLTYADVVTKVDATMNNGNSILPGSILDDKLLTGVEMFQDIFARLANPASYPIYFHCSSGADRTGALAFLIEALLGVSYDDMVRDFELTTFCPRIIGGRLRCDPKDDFSDFDYSTDLYTTYDKWPEKGYCPKWPRLIFTMTNFFGEDLQKAVESFLRFKCGIPEETLNQVKENLTEQL